METGLYLPGKPPHHPVSISLGFEPEQIQWGKGRRGPCENENPLYSSHLLFWDERGPEGYPNHIDFQNLESPIPITPLLDLILNPLILVVQYLVEKSWVQEASYASKCALFDQNYSTNYFLNISYFVILYVIVNILTYRKTLCLSPPPNDQNFSKLRRGA